MKRKSLALSLVLAFPIMFVVSLAELFGGAVSPFIRGGDGFGWPLKFGAIGFPFLSAGFFRLPALLVDLLIPFSVILIVCTVGGNWKSSIRTVAAIGVLMIIFLVTELVQARYDFKRIDANWRRAKELCDRICDANSDGICDLTDWNLLKQQYRDAPYRCEDQTPDLIARLDADGNGRIDSEDPFILKLCITGSVSTEEIVEIYQPNQGR